MQPQVFVALLYVQGLISFSEARDLEEKLYGRRIPKAGFIGVIRDVEEILGRELDRRTP